MKQGEDSDYDQSYDCRRSYLESNCQPKDDDGEGNPNLRDRQGNSSHTKGASDRHNDQKARRKQPQSPAPVLRGQEANGDHRENMVDTSDRMHQAVQKPGCAIMSRMSQRYSGSKNEEGSKHRRDATYHRHAPSTM